MRKHRLLKQIISLICSISIIGLLSNGFYSVNVSADTYDESDGDYFDDVGYDFEDFSDDTFEEDDSEDSDWSDTDEYTENNNRLAVGTVVAGGGLKYKVTDFDEVTLVGVSSAEIKKVTVPATVKIEGSEYEVVSVAKNAFKGNKKITRVTIKADLDRIGDNAFSGCKNLKRIDLCGDIAEIGRKAFYKCTNLKQIYITTEDIKTIEKKAFSKTADKATVKVPAGKVNAYKKMLTKAGISKKAVVK